MLRPVRTDRVGAVDRLPAGLHRDARRVLADRGHLGAALDHHALRLERRHEHRLGVRLRQHHHRREGRIAASHVVDGEGGGERTAHIDRDAGREDAVLQRPVDEAERLEELERARMDRERPRFLHGACGLVEDANRDAASLQQQRRHQACRPGTDDDDIASHGASSQPHEERERIRRGMRCRSSLDVILRRPRSGPRRTHRGPACFEAGPCPAPHHEDVGDLTRARWRRSRCRSRRARHRRASPTRARGSRRRRDRAGSARRRRPRATGACARPRSPRPPRPAAG